MKAKKYEGFGDKDDPKLIIIISPPEKGKEWVHKKGIRFLIWSLQRLSLTNQKVYVEYDENLKARDYSKTYVFMGESVCKYLIKSKFVFKNHVHQFHLGAMAWICPSIRAALVGAAETYRISRTLMLAAKDAGLNPEIDFTIPMFDDFIEK